MTESAGATSPALPLFYRSLRPLAASSHAALRIKSGDYGFTAQTPSIPIVVSEFAEAARFYPIVFAASDATPLAVLGLDGRNLFVDGGRWAEGAYVPAYVRRYPFGYLRVGDEPRFILGLDFDYEGVSEGEDGEALFESGRPSAVTQRALGFCEAFRGEAEATLALGRALEARELLVDRQADAALPDGRKFAVSGFKVVDAERYAKLDAATLSEWHTRGWLALVTHHLNSLSRFPDLLARRSDRSEPDGAHAPAAESIAKGN